MEEYILVGNILVELCDKLFNQQSQRFKKLLEDCKKIENLTPKTVEIAQQSIKSLCEVYPQKTRILIQKNVYSELEINGKAVRIFHKDFLENPSILTDQLKTRKQISSNDSLAYYTLHNDKEE